MDKSKILKIEIISSSIEPKGNCLIINPLGLTESKREEKDGITYFGYEDNNKNKNKNKTSIDYIIEPKGDKCDERFFGKHFQIKFNYLDLNYYIKDLGFGFGTFIKIQEWTELKSNLLLNIGENYIVFSFGDDENEELEEEKNVDNDINKENYNYLNVKVFSLKTQKIFTLTPDNCPVTIGRSSDNSICIDDDMLSRIHCTIDFEKDKWYIQDGYAKNGLQEEEIKKSTNGSWIYVYDEIPITDKMIFKANHNLFICNLV